MNRVVDWLQLRRMVGRSPATPLADQEGQLRYERTGNVDGVLYVARRLAAGTYDWAAVPAGDATNPGAIAGKVWSWDGTSTWTDQWVYTVTYGPFLANDLPATATTQAGLLMFNTATAVSQTTNEIRAGRTGSIVGMAMVSDAARTAGTATARIRLSGVTTTFDADSVQLNATLTTQATSIVAPGSGIALTSGANRIGVDIVTSGWAPTTANVSVWVHVLYSPIA